MDFRYYAKYNPTLQTKLNYKMSCKTSVRRDPCNYECACGWATTNREEKAINRIIRLHNKKCKEGTNAKTITVNTQRTVKHYGNGGVSDRDIVAIGLDEETIAKLACPLTGKATASALGIDVLWLDTDCKQEWKPKRECK